MSEGAPAPIRRRFLRVGDRRVHYLRSGDGPPAVLVHSSPANAWLLRPEIARLSRDFTVFAFDTPGFGLSDPLPLQEMEVADLADALAQTLAAIAMPPCPMFGSHTGAAIALEFGVRHPDRVTGLVFDGVPAFTREEFNALFGDYFRPLPVSDLGGQYATAWTRFRDQAIWFPWSGRTPDRLNAYDLSPPESTHLWVSMYFDAAEHYIPAYRAALRYGPRAVEAAGELTLPAIYTATDTDMLHPHMARLLTMNPGQEVRGIGRSLPAKYELIAAGFAGFGGAADAPADPDGIGSGARVERQFLDREDGGQTHLRYAGDRTAPVLLLIHDAPGSSAQLEARIAALASERFVLAPDLPGVGESDPLDPPPSVADYAAFAAALLDTLRIARAQVVGIGFGASVAVELARRSPDRVAAVGVEGLLLPTSEARADLRDRYAPPIAIAPDGSHWYRTWLMLRDSLVWWPWCDRREANQRRVLADFDGQAMHRWTVDVMRRHATYAHPIHAAFDHDAAEALAAVSVPLVRLEGGATPLAAYDPRLAELAPHALVRPAGGALGSLRVAEDAE